MGRIGMGVVREDRDLAGGASRDSQSSYQRFVEEMTRLNLWYVHRLLSKGEIGPNDLPGALTSRVNIYRMTVLWDGLHDPKFGHVDPEWVQISRQLATLLSSTPSGETSIAEERGLHLLSPLLEWNDPDRLYQVHRRSSAPGLYGCWTFSLEWVGIADREGRLGKLRNRAHVKERVRKALGMRPSPPRDVLLHFQNVLKPLSPFDDFYELASSLLRLIGGCQRDYPSVRELWFESWLNSVPLFVSLFPASWLEDSRLPAPTNYLSLWGQFLTKTGGFNDRVAQRFRESDGCFPYRSLRCHAPIKAVEAHLAELCSGQPAR